LSVELGTSEISFPDRAKQDGTLTRISLKRKLTQITSLEFALGKQLSDSASIYQLIQGGELGVSAIENEQAASDPFESKYVSFLVRGDYTRTGLVASLNRVSERYDIQSSLNRDSTRYEIALTRRLTRRFDLDVALNYLDRDWVNRVTDDQTTEFSVGLSRSIGRSGRFVFRGNYYDRDSSQSGQNLNELRFGIRFSWSLLGREKKR
jgi:hypothetical protein